MRSRLRLVTYTGLTLCLSGALVASSCFDSGSRWLEGAGSGAGTQPGGCTTGQERCVLGKLERCGDGAGGSGWGTVEDCASKGLVCAGTLHACSVCVPGEYTCKGADVLRCRTDGTKDELVKTCDAPGGEACRAGACANLCASAAKERSNVGCEYWGVDLDNAMISATSNAAAQQYAIVVSNAQPDVTAHVRIFQDDGLPGDAPAPKQIQEAMILPLNLQVFKLGPREVDGSPDGEFNTGTHTALTRHAYKVVSNYPVVAFQFNPLDNVNVFSNDASLLKPREALVPATSALVPAYVVAGWPQTIAVSDDPSTNFDPFSPINLRVFLTIVGTTEDTTVRLRPKTAVVAGGPVAATPAGGLIEQKIGAFDVLNLETGSFNADFTGTVVEADKAIVVFTGSEASDAPHFTTLADRRCCADHLEQQLDPLRTAGKVFAIAHTPNRSKAVMAAGADIKVVAEPDYIRFVAATQKGAVITTTLPPPADKIPLTYLGDFGEVTAYGDFMVKSSDPITVLQVMGSQDSCGVPRGLPGGDPSLLIEPPIEQFRNDYVFLTPDKYAFEFFSVVAPFGTKVMLDDTPLERFNCEMGPADGLTAAQRGAKDPPFVVYRCQLDFPVIDPLKVAPDNLSVGVQNDGVHRVVANQPIGLVVVGFDSYVSFAYAGGTDLREISPLQ